MASNTASKADSVSPVDLVDVWKYTLPSSLILSTAATGTYSLAYKSTWSLTHPLLPVSTPQRITGVMIHIYGTVDAGDNLGPFLRCGSQEWSDAGAWTTAVNKHQYYWLPTNPFTNRRWSSSDLIVDFEAGYYDDTATGGSTINTFDVFVATEQTPTEQTPFNGDGYHWQWDHWPVKGAVATGWLDFVLSGLVDNDRFTLLSGWDTAVFEFQVTGGFVAVPNRVTIDVSGSTTDAEVAAAAKLKIEDSGSWDTGFVNISATQVSNRLNLANLHPGVHGNGVITVVSGGSGVVASPNGMSNGVAVTSPKHEAVYQDDGDRSYLTVIDDSAWKTSWRIHGDANGHIPDNHDLHKVTLFARAKGNGTIKPFVRECGVDVSDDAHLTTLTSVWTDYRWTWYFRPTFALYGEASWLPAWVKNADWGFENVSGINKITGARIEWFSAVQPSETVYLLPSSNGVFGTDWTIGAPDVGESKYEDVNSVLIDDTSYISADLSSSVPLLQTFTLGILGTYNVWNVRWLCRLKSDAAARVAPVWHDIVSGEHYLGRAFDVDTNDWVSHAEDFWINPFTGNPWTTMDLQNKEIGIAMVSCAAGAGTLSCSRLGLKLGLVPASYSDTSEATFTATFTDKALENIRRCVGDRLVWKVDKFSVGSGGFQELHPGSVLPLDATHDSLADPVWEGVVTQASFQDWTANYWCALVPNSLSSPVGELMLWARIISSDKASDVVDTYFPMAVAQFPAAWHTSKDIRVLKISLTFNENLVQRWHTDGVTATDTKTVV